MSIKRFTTIKFCDIIILQDGDDMIEFITTLDFYILNAIQNMRNGFLDAIMPVITFMGSGGAVWILIAIIMICFKKSRKYGIIIGAALLIGFIFSTNILKELVGRERPFNTEGALLTAQNLLIGIPSGRYSFPSGHTISSFSSAAAVFMYNKRYGIGAYILAVLISFSRLYLYVHFPSDVIAGAVLGILITVLSRFIVNKIWEKINERKLSNNTR